MTLFRPAIVAAIALLAPAVAGAASITFDEPGDQLSQFTILSNTNAAAINGYTEGATAGIGSPASTGLLHVSGGSIQYVSALYTGEVFDFTGGTPFTLSIFFRISSLTIEFQRPIFLGLSHDTTTGLNLTAAGGAYIAGYMDSTTTAGNYIFKIATKSAGGSPVSYTLGSATLNLTDYYKLTMTFQRSTTVNSIRGALLLENYGSAGISAPTTLVSSSLANYPNSQLYTDSATYAGFSGTEGLSNNYDNFSTTGGAAVPEPTAGALLLLGAAALGRVRARR